MGERGSEQSTETVRGKKEESENKEEKKQVVKVDAADPLVVFFTIFLFLPPTCGKVCSSVQSFFCYAHSNFYLRRIKNDFLRPE